MSKHSKHLHIKQHLGSTCCHVYNVIRNFSDSGSGSYSLDPTSTSQLLSTTNKAVGDPSPKSGSPDVVPPRPAPPTKTTDSRHMPSSVCIPRHISLQLISHSLSRSTNCLHFNITVVIGCMNVHGFFVATAYQHDIP